MLGGCRYALVLHHKEHRHQHHDQQHNRHNQQDRHHLLQLSSGRLGWRRRRGGGGCRYRRRGRSIHRWLRHIHGRSGRRITCRISGRLRRISTITWRSSHRRRDWRLIARNRGRREALLRRCGRNRRTGCLRAVHGHLAHPRRVENPCEFTRPGCAGGGQRRGRGRRSGRRRGPLRQLLSRRGGLPWIRQSGKGLRPDARLCATRNTHGWSFDRGRRRSRLVQHPNQPRNANPASRRSALDRLRSRSEWIAILHWTRRLRRQFIIEASRLALFVVGSRGGSRWRLHREHPREGVWIAAGGSRGLLPRRFGRRSSAFQRAE